MSVTYQSNIDEAKKRILKAERAALNEIGKFIVQKAFNRCPVAGGASADGRYVSKIKGPVKNAGKLRDSIRHRIKTSRGEKYVMIGTPINEKWSLKVEKGTRGQRAEPFLTPAAEENISEIVAIAARTLSLVGEGYSIPEVADELGISRAKAYRMVRAGEITGTKVGKKVWVSKNDMARLSRR